MVENRYVGMKCRGVYENPAGTLLFALHRDLEGICMDRELLRHPRHVAVPYSHAVYNGYWFSPEREAMQAFFDKSQETVTGTVRAKLYKGGVWPLARTSPYSLFSEDLPRSKAATTITRTRRASSASTACAWVCTRHQKQDGEIEHSNFEMQRVSKIIRSSPVPARPQGPAPASARAGLFYNGSAE